MYRFERRRIRNSELLKLIRTAADTNRFSVATYVREAVIADHDRKVAEAYLRQLSEKASHKEWFVWPMEKRSARAVGDDAFASDESSVRAEIELLVPQP